MFFSTYVLTKKGPLAKIWLAAHWDKKLTKNEVQVVNLRETIMHIIHPVVPIAIRTSGELLIGVVRIYALKVKHLFREATTASVQLVMAGIAKKNALILEKKDSTKPNGKPDPSAGGREWVGRTEAEENPADAAGGQFNAIADLLGGISMDEKAVDEDILRAAWYGVEPVAQNESHHTQQDFDEIAKMKADLMWFGERARSGSNSNSSKSKSSLSSIEKARGSHVLGEDDDIPFPLMTEDLDIGMPLPDELPIEFPVFGDENGEKNAEDPFFIPELLPEGSTAAFPTITNLESRLGGKRTRQVHVLDLLATTLPREEVEKNMANRSDIVERYGARHGPGNEKECMDRYHIAGMIPPSDRSVLGLQSFSAVTAALKKKKLREIDLLPASSVTSPFLRLTFMDVLFSRALHPLLHSHLEKDEARDKHELNLFSSQEGMMEGGAVDSSVIYEQPTVGSKRSRDENKVSAMNLSDHASIVLERIERIIESQPQKKRRGEERFCTFADLCQNSRRREVARTFVDLLTLFSKQYLAIDQEKELGPIILRLVGCSTSS